MASKRKKDDDLDDVSTPKQKAPNNTRTRILEVLANGGTEKEISSNIEISSMAVKVCDSNGIEICLKCIQCGAGYALNNSTRMKYHFKAEHPDLYEKLKNKLKKELLTKMIARLSLMSNLPFNVADNPAFKWFVCELANSS